MHNEFSLYNQWSCYFDFGEYQKTMIHIEFVKTGMFPWKKALKLIQNSI